MLVPLQARPSRYCENLSRALGPHGHSLPGAASYEAVPSVDETCKDPQDRTSLSPIKGVASVPIF